MKRVLVVLIGMALVGGAAAAETFEASSKIVDVTVFPDRALVTRRAEVQLAKGAAAVRLAPLPGTIEADSVSVKGQGEARVTLFGAKVITTQLPATQSPKVKELEEQLKQLDDKRQQWEQAKEVVRQQREFLASIKAASVEQIGKDIVTKAPSPADVSGLLALLGDGLTASYQKDREADIQLRQIAEEQDRVQRELAQLQGVGGRQETAIVVELEAENTGRFTLDVAYRLPGATWTPVYEVRATGAGSAVELTAYGMIRQRTNEEWQDVSVTLSTAKPAIGGRMPEMQPWWLRKMEPMALEQATNGAFLKQRRRLAQQEKEDLASVEGLREYTSFAAAAAVAEATVETKGPAVLFTLPKRETIPSDWQPHKAAIATHTLPTALAYETTPRLSPYAYLRAKTTNNTELVLLAGEVQVFLDGAFVESSSIDVVGPGEQFDLFLGIDERIRVKHRQLKAKVDVSVLPGLHGQMKTIDYEYLTTVENFRPGPATITVIDQIPVSQHDEIKIENAVYDPKPAEEDKEKPGVSRWTLQVTAGGRQAIKLSYRVKHPVNFMVEGL